uniref:Zinc finger AN1-type containing 2B n=2 Tax=Neoaves TaxID=3078114 RepID=A0A674HIF7_TAEGU
MRDFLPLKCDACEQIFCTDHIAYAQHDCTSAYKKDVQVPVCPLCNTPVPVRRGEMPDVVVGEHIDRDCKSDPAQRKRKIFTNKCLKPGCKQKEMMKVICDQCHKNYCLKHRHPLDHDCSGAGHPLSKAGHAAVTRAQASSSKIVTASSSGAARPADSSSSLACARGGRAAASQTRSTSPPAVMLQNGLSEEEALQRALEMSLAESARTSAQQPRFLAASPSWIFCSLPNPMPLQSYPQLLPALRYAEGLQWDAETQKGSEHSAHEPEGGRGTQCTTVPAAHRRRRIWHWPRHCQRAKPSTSSRSGRCTVQSHQTAACRRQVRWGVPADTGPACDLRSGSGLPHGCHGVLAWTLVPRAPCQGQLISLGAVSNQIYTDTSALVPI